MSPKQFLLDQYKIKRDIWANARDHDKQEYIFGIHFCPYNKEKKESTKFANFANFLVFTDFGNFQQKL
jgi:hypothetical protein